MIRFPEFVYMRWAKTHPRARFDLSGSGAPQCPAGLLHLRPSDVVTRDPGGYGWPPLVAALAARYRVSERQVASASGGTSLANWLGCAAVLEGCGSDAEVVVERPTYEQLLRLPQSFGCRVRRLDRRFGDRFAIDIDRLRGLVNRRTRLLLLSDLHNPSGARLDRAALREAAALLERVGGYVLVDEVYLETRWGERTDSAVRLAPNVLTTNSLTKAYGLDGLRAGWLLAPPRLAKRARQIHDYLGVNGVATGERMALRALENLPAIRARAQRRMRAGLALARSFMAAEPRLAWIEPEGGTVCFPRLPAGLDGDRLARHLLRRHSTLVAPGSFFEAPRHLRIGLTSPASTLREGLSNLVRSLATLG